MISPVKIWRNQKKVKKLLDREGTILTFTKIFVPPSGYESQAPYAVAVAEFKDGSRFFAQFVDFEENQLKIGQKIKTVLRKTRDPGDEGIIPYGIKFKPIK